MKKPPKIILFAILFYANHSTAQTQIQFNDFEATERDDGTTFSIGTNRYCGSGLTPWFSATADFYSFNTNTELWYTIAPLSKGMERQYASEFSDGQFSYAIAGISGNNFLNDLW